MLLEDASSSVVLKTDSPASQKKEVIINYEKNINENPRNSLQKHLSVGMELWEASQLAYLGSTVQAGEDIQEELNHKLVG